MQLREGGEVVLPLSLRRTWQALQRTQRPLPMEFGYLKTTTHDYIRYGMITLFAAMDYLQGEIFGRLEGKRTRAY